METAQKAPFFGGRPPFFRRNRLILGGLIGKPLISSFFRSATKGRSSPYNFHLVGFTRIYSDLVAFFSLWRRLPPKEEG